MSLQPEVLGKLSRHVPADDIPASEDLFSADELERHLAAAGEDGHDLIVVGDIMLGGRSRPVIAAHGPDHLFAAVRPRLSRASATAGNLEGPLARHAAKADRHFSYRVSPTSARWLADAGIRVVTAANNHLMDCGRQGVLETLDALAAAGVYAIGVGSDEDAAHQPAFVVARGRRIGLLGYYWNRRCAAGPRKPGAATDSPEELARDIGRLRGLVDHVVVTFHWGIPYDRSPQPADRDKARLAIDLGADAVVGHHPHVLQTFEVYRGRPIVYSVGNFTFGSGNTRGEGMAVGFRFRRSGMTVDLHPVYVKNRDPRVDYQPKVMRGAAAVRVLRGLAERSGAALDIDGVRGRLNLEAPC
jgi:poly-gamma-glutamate capsule biosynthesis protein CapA/YwtB (metallophosphatase superfamily)